MNRALSLASSLTIATSAMAIDFASLDSLLQARYADQLAPGGAVLIAQGDSILFERYFGLADIQQHTPIGPDTRFCIASVSKQFTIMALLQQLAANPGLLDRPVSDFFNFPQAFWHNIALRNLANHTSGVPDARPRNDRNWCLYANEDQSIEYFPTVQAPDFGPGEYYDYLNPSFILLSKVVERLANCDFYRYVAENLFAPAKMDSTYYFNPEKTGKCQSHAYIPDDAGWAQFDYGEETFFATRPDGGIYSTARNLLAWENALRDGKIVPADVLAMAYRPSVSVSDSPRCSYQRRPNTWYGLGYFIEHPADKPVKVFHTGDNGGYQAYLAKYPDLDIKIIVLENRNDQSRSQLTSAIDHILNLR